MANDISRETTPAVSLFQKAHGRMTSLQKLDDQLESILDQRRKIQDELRTIQSLINEEFDRVVSTPLEPSGRISSQPPEALRTRENGTVAPLGSRVEIAEVLT